MMVRVRCPQCATESLVHARAAVKGVHCKSCNARVRVGSPPPPLQPDGARSDDKDWTPLPPRQRPFPWATTLLCLLMLGCAGYWWWHFGRPVAGGIDGSAPSSTIASALARVVTGAEIVGEDGKHRILPLTQGTGFVVSATGYILTSRGVVDQVWSARHRRDHVQWAVEQLTAQFETPLDEDQLAEVTAKVRAQVKSVEPRVWVFLPGQGGPQVLEAELVSVATDEALDLAVLRAPTTFTSFFRLLRELPADMAGKEVFAPSFPDPLPVPAPAIGPEPEFTGVGLDRIQDLLGKPTSPHTTTHGVFNRLQDPVIEHDAQTGPGSAGGPLIDSSGLVLGIITGESRAVAVGSLYDLLQRHAHQAHWE